MVSVMNNNEFDLERNPNSIPLPDQPRVSSNFNLGDQNSDIDEIRVSVSQEESRVSSGRDLGAQKSEIDEVRVSSGDEGIRVSSGHDLSVQKSEVDEIRVSVGKEGSDDSRVLDVNVDSGEIELRVQDHKSVDGEDEGGSPKGVVVRSTDDRMRGMDDLDSPSGSDSDAIGGEDDAMGKGLVVDATNDEFRLESRGNLQDNDVDGVVTVGSMKILGSEFEMGDMVWGKVKSHPWWPGHIYNEAFASSSVRRSRRDGHVLVAFFGDSSYGWFDLTELVLYEPNFTEKSQQTSSRNFMNAVEESIDEASRRSALGLSCRCRNPHNFRPANVPGYMVVDIVDYEPATIYSASQIQKARERFRPADTLSFIKQLAAMPSSSVIKSYDSIANKAAALAYRRSVFEEFDETYSQAFGHQPIRPSGSPTPKEPSRAPLSGPLVMAETLGGRKSSNKGAKPKEVSKKDRYLFKRRDEAVNLRKMQTSQAHGSSSSPSAQSHGTSESPTASYVFQKRDQIVSVKDELSGAPHMVTKDILNEGLDVVASPASGGLEQSELSFPDKRFAGVGSNDGNHTGMSGSLVKKRKKKADKYPGGELSSEKPDISEKKAKKKLRRTEVNSDAVPYGSGGLIKAEKKPVKIDVSYRESKGFETSDSGFVEGNGEELPELLADLRGLALNPFNGVERNRPAIVRHFFLKYRGLVFLKSYNASPPPESEPSEARANRSPPPPDSRKNYSFKKSKLSVRHDDPTKGGRKRVPSERQEEISAKRAKKITDVKLLASERKAAALLKNNPNPEFHQSDGKGKTLTVQPPPFSRLTKTEQHSKKPPRVEEPTFLVMKFPLGSSLPSLMELKARFARYGPMDTSLSRVFYKTNTCRVAFLYKQDANIACRYAVSNSHFSNVKCLLRPVEETQSPQPGSDPRDSSTAEPRPPLLSQQELKSCLKKPDEPGVGPTNGSTSVKMARVRFNMGEDNNQRSGVPVQMAEDSRNANLSSESGPSSSSFVGMDSVSNNQRFISLNPLQPPLLPTPSPEFLRPSPSINLPNPRHFEVNNLNYNASGPPGPASVPPPPPPPPGIDISQQMMSLLTSCHDAVTNLESILGYMPYHPL